MFDVILKPIGWLMEWCYSITGHYAIALLLFSFFIQLILCPLGIKQQKNTLKQAALRPKELAIRKKYKGRNDKPTQMKMQQEIQDMYQAEGYNQLGGCLPLLIQLPIIWMLYSVITKPVTYILGLGTEVVESITNAYKVFLETNGTADQYMQEPSLIKFIVEQGREGAMAIEGVSGEVYESIVDLSKGFSFFGGTSMLDTPSLSAISWLILIPILVYVSSLATTLVTQKYSVVNQDAAATPMNGPLMKYGMPLIGVIFCFRLSAAIGIYWVYRSLYSILQTFILNKVMPIPVITQEQIAIAEAALKKKKKKKKVLLIEVDEDDDAYDDLVVSEERAARIKAKNEKLALEEAQEDKKIEELNSTADKTDNNEDKPDND